MSVPGGVIKWADQKLDFTGGTLVMGILNVTPDSFSDGGQFIDPAKAIEQGIAMAGQGAAIIDVGAESTRPGSEPVSVAEQIERVIPVIETLAKEIKIPISIDTYKVDVAKSALVAGASIINDITALADNDMARLAAQEDVLIILMHMQGTPATMQKQPHYDNVVEEVLRFLTERARKAEEFAIPREKIFIDPGIGFGKTLEHNLLLLKNIDKFVASGYRVLVGTSRKGFLGAITGKKNPTERMFATAATVAHCAAAGVSIVRVHDVAEMLDVVKVINAVKNIR
ncbi:MAG: dihydropteroate synthase [Phycisphaerae bacterium]|jgi:dihydropteroate synthase